MLPLGEDLGTVYRRHPIVSVVTQIASPKPAGKKSQWAWPGLSEHKQVESNSGILRLGAILQSYKWVSPSTYLAIDLCPCAETPLSPFLHCKVRHRLLMPGK